MTTLHHGDCLEVLRGMPDNSVDSIVTDPPYGLSFMGKRWDYDVPAVEVWAECLRVLKPGGHLLAFAGTRTQHRMAVRIEDAGFEIRDMIAWVYSSGFPKSMNLDRLKGDKICGCPLPYPHNETEQKTKCDLRPVRDAHVSQAKLTAEECREVLQQSLQEQGTPAQWFENCSGLNEGREQSGLEGWSDAQKASRELCASEVCPCSGMGEGNGSERRLCDGASSGDGAMVRTNTDAHGVRTSHQSRPTGQQAREFGAVAGQPKPQTMGAWATCGHCGKPVVQSGLGTALKPALEPITVARKPLTGTVAANVLAHGTGALNIDGCRVGGDAGRWPANLIHDGSKEVLAGFPVTESGGSLHQRSLGRGACFGKFTPGRNVARAADTGSAARFFYCAKASKRDRDDGNGHPTVKPTDLMAYLCRLVTPPGGTVLDPFMGSGSTGKAAVREGFRFVGIEREAEYLTIAQARIKHASQDGRLL